MSNVPYSCKVNWHLVSGNGSLIPIRSLSNRSLLPSLNVYVFFDYRCDGKPSCEAFANSTDFPSETNPCPSTVKYLEAQFYCSQPQERKTSARPGIGKQ